MYPDRLDSIRRKRGNVEVGRSVSKAIADRLMGDMEPAMLHACNAVDGTAKKMYPNMGVGARFRKLLRESYAGILEPMAPGVNLEKTVFPIPISGATGPGGHPDVADILYAIHRCHHGHGDALPGGYELIPDTTTEPARTTMKPGLGPNGDWVVHLSDRILYGMAAVALLAPVKRRPGPSRQRPSDLELDSRRTSASGWTTAGGAGQPNSRPSRRWTGTGSASPSTLVTTCPRPSRNGAYRTIHGTSARGARLAARTASPAQVRRRVR